MLLLKLCKSLEQLSTLQLKNINQVEWWEISLDIVALKNCLKWMKDELSKKLHSRVNAPKLAKIALDCMNWCYSLNNSKYFEKIKLSCKICPN